MKNNTKNMITYELAKQLKDAGFPQKENCKGRSCPKGDFIKYIGLDENFACFPTLSELIEACGKETLVLWRYNKNWFAGLRGIRNDRDSNGTILTDTHTLVIDYEDYKMGKTLEEAVAKLWLKLNKPKR